MGWSDETESDKNNQEKILIRNFKQLKCNVPYTYKEMSFFVSWWKEQTHR